MSPDVPSPSREPAPAEGRAAEELDPVRAAARRAVAAAARDTEDLAFLLDVLGLAPSSRADTREHAPAREEGAAVREPGTVHPDGPAPPDEP